MPEIGSGINRIIEFTKILIFESEIELNCEKIYLKKNSLIDNYLKSAFANIKYFL